MASRTASRPLQCVVKRVRPSCECASMRASIRQFSASRSRAEQSEADRDQRPRWSYTPEEMKAPFPWKSPDPSKVFRCNEDPDKLDRFYTNFLGRGGDTMLADEVKWLAVTHKSFDQGRRGFNDRLAFFGRRILTLQTNLALLNSPTTATRTHAGGNPSDDRIPFSHPALEGLENLSTAPVGEILTKERLGALATQVGMRDIMRWQPRMVNALERSGVDVVLTTCMYAVIGAISLHRGGAVATEVAREKILKPLGIS
ncbi:hypothetical protein LOCC1_G004768 [Lachnellula occidentalis]|uniref:RNase III domain-containing protein n=1 Tax=Lachnellula occidentalis TaxID=215460 RepID=A0A8H8UCD6_9HELO|nr:hypothetical protein LOCC1_G004768 [Lachnellula occidentalis]